jgi:hypothetical protein
VNPLRRLIALGFFRKQGRRNKPLNPGDYLLDGDGAYLTDENGNKLTG